MNQMTASLGGEYSGCMSLDADEKLSRSGGVDYILGGIPMEICVESEKRGFGKLINGMLDFDVEGMKRFLDDIVLEAGCNILRPVQLRVP